MTKILAKHLQVKSEPDPDTEEIIAESLHMPDRDQAFTVLEAEHLNQRPQDDEGWEGEHEAAMVGDRTAAVDAFEARRALAVGDHPGFGG